MSNEICDCTREQQKDCYYDRQLSKKYCRITKESAGQVVARLKLSGDERGESNRAPVPADPAAIDAEIAKHARRYANCAIGEKGAALERTFDNCIRAWLAKHGTRNDGLREARKMLQENGCSCLADDALEKAIAALSSK